MTSRTLSAWLLPILLLGSAHVFAQAEGAPKPGPEHQKLSRFIGKWTGSGEALPGPFGPGGKMTWTESCEWFTGNFHVICHSESKGAMGDMKGIGIIGYDAGAKRYTWFGVDSNGWSSLSKGTFEGKTWSFLSEETVAGKTWKSRFTIEETGAASQKFRWELSEDGATWTLGMEGESHK